MRILLVIIGTYALALYIAFTLQEKMIFYPQKLPDHYNYGLTLPDTEVTLKTVDGASINGLLLQGPSHEKIVIFFHGNAGNLATWQETAELIKSLGTNVLIIDYRGYGKSTGELSEEGLYHDAEAAYAYARKEGYSDHQIIFYGRSIGTGIAVEMAKRHEVKGLILESAYTSLPALATTKYPLFIPQLILKYRFNNLDKASQIKMPVLMFHGTKDALIPLSQAEKLESAFAGPHKLVKINGGLHNNIPEYPDYKRELKEFLNSAVTLSPTTPK